MRPVYPGDTLLAESEVIGLREVSAGDAGVVYVRTRGTRPCRVLICSGPGM